MMSVFDRFQRDLFTPTQPEELSDSQAQKRVEETGRFVSDKIEAFARRYLNSDAYERYRDSLQHLRYNVAELPSRVITFFNMFTGRAKRVVEGALAAYDERKNRILSNRYVANDPENDQLEPTIAHERVHHTTTKFSTEYFKKFGEKARPFVEGVTQLIASGLGYDSDAYPEFVYAAYQTLRKMGGDIQQNLYRVLNFKATKDVMETFYRSLEGLNSRAKLQPAYARTR